MKIGNYYVPDISISQAVDMAKTIYKDSISTDESLATKFGHTTTNSGGFIKKMVTLRQLGLIKPGIKGVELTPLGNKIARPVGDEAKQANKELVSHVPLFIEIKKKLGSKNPDKESMLLALIDLTREERGVLDRELSRIQKLYEDALKYITSTSELIDVGGESIMENQDINSQILEIKTGALYMRLPMNLEAIEQAEIMLTAQKQALEKKLKKK